MPQLMPMFWKFSIFMSFMLLFTLIIFYFLKSMEFILMSEEMKLKTISFEFLW